MPSAYSTNLSTGTSTKPTRMIPDYLANTQNYIPLSLFFAGVPEQEADPDSLFGFRMPSRKQEPKGKKKAKSGATGGKGEKEKPEDDSGEKGSGSQADAEGPQRAQTSKPRPAASAPAQALPQAQQAGGKQESLSGVLGRLLGAVQGQSIALQKQIPSTETTLTANVPTILGNQSWQSIASPVDESAANAKSIALMKWLSKVAQELGVGRHVYVVGGAVRNFVIDKPIKDVDVVIDAVSLGRGRDSEWFAKQLQPKMGAKSSLVTNQYGVAILTVKGDWDVSGHNLKGEVIEIANARSESYGGVTGKGYKPSEVKPASIEKDIRRREFTFNCMGGDTLVPTERGILRIDEIADRGAGDRQPIRLLVAGQDGPTTAIGWQYSGHTDTIRIKTEWGHSFTCTHHHPVLVLRGHDHEWIQADQLEDGDLLCVPVRQVVRQAPLVLGLSVPVPPKHGRLKEIQKPEVMTLELAYVIGCLVAEGSNTHKRVSFSNSDPAFISRYVECFQATFGFSPSRNRVVTEGETRIVNDVEFRASRDGYDIYADSRTLVGWFDELGLYCGGAQNGESASHHKVVPWSILQADERSQAAFLAAYLEGDGSIRPSSGRITYCSASSQVRQQLQVLLGAHGILSKVKGRFVYVNAVDSAKLWEKIGSWMVTKRFDYDGASFRSRNRYGVFSEHLVGWLEGRRISVGNNTGPSVFRADDGSEVSLGGVLEKLRRPKRILYDAVARGDYDLFLAGLKMISPSEHARVQRLLNLEYQYVSVVSVEDAGQQDVYDLSMREGVEPAFVANGVIVHNTLMWRLADLARGPDKAEIVDLTGCGLADLKANTMRCPVDPDKTFSDDPTRMLRAIKFMIKYGFKISGDTEKSIRRNAAKIRNAPSSAIAKLLIDPILKEPKTAFKALREMKRLGLLDVVADMIRTDKQFASTLAGWANDQRVSMLFELMDLGLPLKTKLLAFTPSQQAQIRKATATMPDDRALEFLAALKQPGKAWKDKLFVSVLATELGIEKSGMGSFAAKLNALAQEILLSDPVLLDSPDRFKSVIRQKLSVGESMTTTANVPTLSVPIGAGDGKKFLDFKDDAERRRKRKRRSMSRRLYVLLRQ